MARAWEMPSVIVNGEHMIARSVHYQPLEHFQRLLEKYPGRSFVGQLSLFFADHVLQGTVTEYHRDKASNTIYFEGFGGERTDGAYSPGFALRAFEIRPPRPIYMAVSNDGD